MAEVKPVLDSDKKDQLNLILNSPLFLNSKVLSSFLEYIVNETLAGNEQGIKEYMIGVKVLSRHSSFNPQFDGIVRTHAGRLRRALRVYYAENGRSDAIRIEIPKGSYIPVFLSQDMDNKTEKTESAIKLKNRPVVAVLPFRNIS